MFQEFSKSALPDTDYDGIPDVFDSCPTLVKDITDSKTKTVVQTHLTYDSFGDADFDGITDNVDECPNARETYNRYLR